MIFCAQTFKNRHGHSTFVTTVWDGEHSVDALAEYYPNNIYFEAELTIDPDEIWIVDKEGDCCGSQVLGVARDAETAMMIAEGYLSNLGAWFFDYLGTWTWASYGGAAELSAGPHYYSIAKEKVV